MQMYGPRQGSWALPWAKCQIFSAALFICNNINTNINKKFHTLVKLSLFQTVIFIFSRLKKFENEKWPKAGYLPPMDQNSISQKSNDLEFHYSLKK